VKKRFSEEQIVGILREADAGIAINEHWFTSLDHARGVIETWRKEHNDERLKRILGGLIPTEYAKQIRQKADTPLVSL